MLYIIIYLVQLELFCQQSFVIFLLGFESQSLHVQGSSVTLTLTLEAKRLRQRLLENPELDHPFVNQAAEPTFVSANYAVL